MDSRLLLLSTIKRAEREMEESGDGGGGVEMGGGRGRR